jgi:hypothetical protein
MCVRSARQIMVAIIALCFGSSVSVHAKPIKLSTIEKIVLQEPAIATIGPYMETAELGSPAVVSNAFGEAVAISGSRGVVSSPGTGNVAIYDLDEGGIWKLDATLAVDGRVASVAMDGDTFVVGTVPAVALSVAVGTVSVYVHSATGWAKQQDLPDPGATSNDEFGLDVSISGNSILVGAPDANSGNGLAYVFTRTGTKWTLQTKLSASDGALDDWFGENVGIDGNSAVIGAPGHPGAAGAAYVFTRTGTKWSEREKFSGDSAGDNFGSAVAVYGKTLGIGSPGHNGDSGEVYVYTGAGSSWVLQEAFGPPVPIKDGQFGISVGLSGDRMVIGEPGNAAAHVFTRSGTTWTLRAQLGDSSTSDFGTAVALSGTNAIVGAPKDQVSGRAYIFDERDEIFANGFN